MDTEKNSPYYESWKSRIGLVFGGLWRENIELNPSNVLLKHFEDM